MKHIASITAFCATTAFAAACAEDSTGSVTSREEAAQLVVEQLVDESKPTIVLGLEDTVTPADRLVTGVPEGLGEPGELVIERESWFVWIDDDPGALFAHPNRLVLVDRASGELTTLDSMWWPVLNDELPWSTQPTDTEAWLYPTEVTASRQGLVPPSRPLVDTCGGNAGKALIYNGHADGQSLKEHFEHDAQNMDDLLGEAVAGFETTVLGPMGSKSADGATDPHGQALKGWIETAGAEMQPGETLIIYITGHGVQVPNAEGEDANAVIGGIDPKNLARWLERNVDPGVETIVMVDGCYSGWFANGVLDGVADLTVTASAASEVSYGDLDPFWFEWWYPDDPNVNDTGGEWTSAVAGALIEILTDPDATQQQHADATENGEGFWSRAIASAFEGAADLDVANLSGRTTPQIRRGDPALVLPQPPASAPPSCGSDPDDGGSDDGGSDDGSSDDGGSDDGGSDDGGPSVCDESEHDYCEEHPEGDHCSGGSGFWGGGGTCDSAHLDLTTIELDCPNLDAPSSRFIMTVAGDVESGFADRDEYTLEFERPNPTDPGQTDFINFTVRNDGGEAVAQWRNGAEVSEELPEGASVLLSGNQVIFEIPLAEVLGPQPGTGGFLQFRPSTYSYIVNEGQGPSDFLEFVDPGCPAV